MAIDIDSKISFMVNIRNHKAICTLSRINGPTAHPAQGSKAWATTSSLLM